MITASYHMLTHKWVIKYHKDFVLSNPDIYIKERSYHINNTKVHKILQ